MPKAFNCSSASDRNFSVNLSRFCSMLAEMGSERKNRLAYDDGIIE
ncbi:MAG: hypothetical protein PUP93_16460 [Rhizonema sp. NSF051]|nr:hypothetical protein [Rhizonema sp. NSF051]